MDEGYERILLVKPECFVYRLPPRPSNRGYRAADWGLDKPEWTGRMRIVVISEKLEIKLEDKISGELFAKAPVDIYPGVAVEAVTDSSRYFVIRISDGSGRNAFIGTGFADRGDAFDFNVTLQDHFKRVQTDQAIENSIATPQPSLNLGLKEGQTISIKLGSSAAKPKSSSSKPRSSVGGGGLLLPPPPGDTKPTVQPITQSNTTKVSTSSDFGEFSSSSTSDWVQF